MVVYHPSVGQVLEVSDAHISGSAANVRVIGHRNIVRLDCCTVEGDDNSVSGASNVVSGSRNTVGGSCSKVFGKENILNGVNHSVRGSLNHINSSHTYISGDGNTVVGNNCCIVGRHNIIRGHECQAMDQCAVYSDAKIVGDPDQFELIDGRMSPPTPFVKKSCEELFESSDRVATDPVLCSVCMVNLPAVHLSCMHAPMCIACFNSRRDDGCPICRTRFTSWSRVIL